MQNLPFPGLEKSLQGLSQLSQICCWFIIAVFAITVVGLLVRLARMNHSSRADASFTEAFRGSPHLLALFQDGVVFAGSSRAAVYQNTCRELSWHLLGTDSVDRNFMARLRTAGKVTTDQSDAVRRTTQQVAAQLARPFVKGTEGWGIASLPVWGLLASLICLLDGLGGGAIPWHSTIAPLALSLALFLPGSLLKLATVRRARRAQEEIQDFAVEMGVALDRMFVEHRQTIEPLPSLGSMGLTEGPNFSLPPADTTRGTHRSV